MTAPIVPILPEMIALAADILGEGGLVGAVSRKHRIDATAPVYGPDHKASASFD